MEHRAAIVISKHIANGLINRVVRVLEPEAHLAILGDSEAEIVFIDSISLGWKGKFVSAITKEHMCPQRIMRSYCGHISENNYF